jgi:hypothetical protein
VLARPAALGLALAALGGGSPVAAGDVTAFIAMPRPSTGWERGYGAALTSTWFRVVSFEGEAARIPGRSTDQGMTSFTASALLSPPVGPFTPYGGLGIGLFRQNVADDSDTGRLRAWILGLKVKLGGLIVLKGEYRRLDLGDGPLLPMVERYSAGAGIAF